MILIQIFISAFMSSGVLAAALKDDCQIPTDLNANYRRLIESSGSHGFLGLTGNNLSLPNLMQYNGNRTCPDSLPSNGEINERSTCPWYFTIGRDEKFYPSEWPQVTCRCRDCIGTNNQHYCQAVFTKMLFLERTTDCVDGLIVYRQTFKTIATSCSCVRIKTAPNIPFNLRNYILK